MSDPVNSLSPRVPPPEQDPHTNRARSESTTGRTTQGRNVRQTLVKGLKSVLSFLKNLVRPESRRLSERQNPVKTTPSASLKLQKSDISQPVDARLQWGTETLMARGYSSHAAEGAANHVLERADGSLPKFNQYISEHSYQDGREKDFQWAVTSLRSRGYSPAAAREAGHMVLAWAQQTGGDMRLYISKLPERTLQFDDHIRQFKNFVKSLVKKGYTPNDAKHAVLQALRDSRGDFSSIHRRFKKAEVPAPDSIKPRPDLQAWFVTTTVIPWMEDVLRGQGFPPEEIHSITRTLIANAGGPERGDLQMMFSGVRDIKGAHSPESRKPAISREAALRTLGLPITASRSEITKTYYSLARQHHPDKIADPDGSNAELFRKVQLAYETLTKDS